MAAGDTATVFLERTLGTRFVVSFPAGATTVADLKDRVSAEHAACFPRTGPIAVTSLQVKLDGSWFQLTDSMAVRAAFEWVKGPWRLLAEAHELRSHSLARKDAKCGTSDAEPSAGRPVISDNSTQMQYLMPPAGSQGGGSLASGDGVSDTPQINQQDKPQEGDEHTSGQGKDGTTMPLISSDLDLAAGDSDTLLPNQDKPQECVDHASGQIEDGIGMPQESSDIDLATGHSGTPLANQEDKPQECVEHDSGQLEDGITMPQESSDIDLSTGDSGTPLANLGDKPQECVEHASDQLEDGIIMPQKSSDFDLAAGDSDAPPMNQQDKSHDAADHASVQSEDKPTMHQESSDLGSASGRGNGPVGDQQKDIITEARGKKRFRGEDKTNESIIANCGDDLSPFASSTCNAESSEKRSCVTEHAKLNSVPMPYDLEDHSHGLGENLSGGQKETSTSGVHNVESRNSESNIPPGVESMERGKSSDREVKTKRGDEEPQIAGCGGESSCKRTDDPHCVEPMKEDVKRPVSNSHYLDKGKNEGATSNVSIDRVYFRRRHKRIVVPKVPISKAIKIHPFSQWGHDFHPDYRGLGCLKQNFPRVPIMALTATPTESVRKEVLGSLRIPNAVVLKRSFDRLNLNYEVIGKTKTAQKQLGDLLKERFMNKSGIVYCLSKIECADTAEFLREKYKIKCAHYHASLAARQRTSVQEKWHSGEVKVICAPIAFGTGIDKPDMRFVIHNTMSKSIESYYQESGRAGRDDLPAHCIVLYQKIDFSRILCMLRNTDNFNRESFRVAMEQAKKMQSYCKLKTECRRQALLEHFGEQYSRQRCRDGSSPCDNCLKTQL